MTGNVRNLVLVWLGAVVFFGGLWFATTAMTLLWISVLADAGEHELNYLLVSLVTALLHIFHGGAAVWCLYAIVRDMVGRKLNIETLNDLANTDVIEDDRAKALAVVCLISYIAAWINVVKVATSS